MEGSSFNLFNNPLTGFGRETSVTHHPQSHYDNHSSYYGGGAGVYDGLGQDHREVLINVTDCFTLAQVQEVKLGTGCKVMNDFFR